MNRPPLSLAAVLLSITAGAQTPNRVTQENADCSGAIFLSDSIHVQPRAPRGFGNRLEVKENPLEDKQWLEREHNSTWYRFRAPWKGRLTFDIIPLDPQDDIDFLLFKGAIPGFCEKVPGREVRPVRTNISRNDPAIGSRCGLDDRATEAFVRSGVGASYSRALEVEAGELLYLLIDYADRPRSGYTIHFHHGPPPAPEPDPVATKKALRKQVVSIQVTDAATGMPVEASISVEGVALDSLLESRGRSVLRFQGDPFRDLKVRSVAQGYLFNSTTVKGSADDSLIVHVALQPIVEGQSVVLEDIRFVGNEAKVLRSSEPALLLLLRFLQVNPEVRILVEGHVNGPTFKNSKEFIELSGARAKTVYDFLLVNDVDPARIGYVGIGNARMINPDPKNQKESEANRRVEIKVLGGLSGPERPHLGKAGR